MFKSFPYKKVFFVGIGGIGISALAKLLVNFGYHVEGLNEQESPQTLDELRKKGVNINLIQKDQEIDFSQADAIVYSAAWEANFPKVYKSILSSGKPSFVYAKALSLVSREFFTIAVSGSHGKTTTTAMLCKILSSCGRDPNCIVGSLMEFNGKASNYKPGKEKLLVLEACEYKRHFLNFHPDLAVITNIEHEHADYYKTPQEFKKAFEEFMSQSRKVITLENSKISPNQIPTLKVPGAHNKENAALAVSAALELGVSLECALEAVSSYTGSWRRQEYKGKTPASALVYDDYAHHPTEIKSTIQAIKELHKDKKLVVVFEPHTYSRVKAFFDDFVKAFSNPAVEAVYIAPTYSAREKPIPGADAKDLFQALEKVRGNVFYKNFSELEKQLSKYNEDYVILLMGAGDIYKVAEAISNTK